MGPYELSLKEAARARKQRMTPVTPILDDGIDLKRRPPPVVIELVPPPIPPPVPHARLSNREDNWLERRREARPEICTQLSIGDILSAVATRFEVSTICIRSQRRTANIVWPRQLAMYLAKTLTLHSLPTIGRLFGGRDHSTVFHAVKKVERLQANPEVALALTGIVTLLRDRKFAIPQLPFEEAAWTAS